MFLPTVFREPGSFCELVFDAVATAINQTRKKGKPNSLQVKTPATADTVAFAALYMPPSVQVSYGANYGETEIGVIADELILACLHTLGKFFVFE